MSIVLNSLMQSIQKVQQISAVGFVRVAVRRNMLLLNARRLPLSYHPNPSAASTACAIVIFPQLT